MTYTVTFDWEDSHDVDTLVHEKIDYDSYATAVASYFVHLIGDEDPEIYRDGKPIEDEVLYDEELFKKCFYDDKDLLIMLLWDTVPYEVLWKKVLDYRRMLALYKKFN